MANTVDPDERSHQDLYYLQNVLVCKAQRVMNKTLREMIIQRYSTQNCKIVLPFSKGATQTEKGLHL